jgi:hypothetical protein
MFFNLKSIVLYGLLAVATASPILNIPDPEGTTTVQLEARTKKKGVSQSFKLLNGGIISKDKIARALSEVRTYRAKPENEWPPGLKPFGNSKATNGLASRVFADKPMGDDSNLLEYPVPLPGERAPGSLRLVTTAGATPNFVGMMQHPPSSRTAFKKLSPAPEEECQAESSTGTKHTTRDLWEFVKRKVTGKKAKPAGKACPLKPKCTAAMKKAGKCKTTTPAKCTAAMKKAGKCKGKTSTKKPAHKKPAHKKPAHKKPAHKKPAHKKPAHKKPAHKKPAHKKPAHKRPTHKRPTRPSRKGGRRGGRRGGRH